VTAARVVVLADDLIWSTRLSGHLTAIGASPLVVRDAVAFVAALPGADGAIVDLTARAYDGIAAIQAGHRAGTPVLALGQHDDVELRKRALAAGADRVHPYRKLFEDGPATLRAWLAAAGSPTAHP
jgi:DNA-binding response OmpR family regulator